MRTIQDISEIVSLPGLIGGTAESSDCGLVARFVVKEVRIEDGPYVRFVSEDGDSIGASFADTEFVLDGNQLHFWIPYCGSATIFLRDA